MGRHWPMEKLERSTRLVEHTIALAAGLGFATKDAATGGASDANTTAGMGVAVDRRPGPHRRQRPLRRREYLEVDSIAPRTALVAALLQAIGADPVIAELARRPRLTPSRDDPTMRPPASASIVVTRRGDDQR